MAKKIDTTVTLVKSWQEYQIDVSKSDLTYVLCGFGWSANAMENMNRDIVFYIDQIISSLQPNPN